jgi:phosphatidylglycerol:prolipoprotein diacylglycerol transferase
MHFPIYLRIGPLVLNPHWVFEVLAYIAAFCLYLMQRRKRGDALSTDMRWWLIAAMLAGAAIGSKVLFWFEDPRLTAAHWNNPSYLLSGKTIVGALIGGLIAVEWAKRRLGITQRTGDLFVLPLIAGTAVGRIGCLLTGIEDQTAGIHTSLPWGVDFGDGPRHPTQIYEIIFLMFLAGLIIWFSRRPHRQGSLFKLYFVSYLAFRLAVDSIKPEVRVFARLSSIQCACLLLMLYLLWDWRRESSLPMLGSIPNLKGVENVEMEAHVLEARE